VERIIAVLKSQFAKFEAVKAARKVEKFISTSAIISDARR